MRLLSVSVYVRGLCKWMRICRCGCVLLVLTYIVGVGVGVGVGLGTSYL